MSFAMTCEHMGFVFQLCTLYFVFVFIFFIVLIQELF